MEIRKRYRSFFNFLVLLKENGNYSTELLAHYEFKEFILNNFGKPRKMHNIFTQRHADIAACFTRISLNETVLHKFNIFKKRNRTE